MATPTAIVGYLALFAAIGFLFLFANLVIGRLVRPSNPHAEKLEIYECGEPTIGSSFVQFDLRYYVVALVFLVFDVEVAFLFPLATVYGKAVQMADDNLAVTGDPAADGTGLQLSGDAMQLHRELGVVPPAVVTTADELRADARQLAKASMSAILVFFVILLVGFAYEWKTGAFDWVRVMRQERTEQLERPPPAEMTDETSVVSA
jgi:NADH-quinone oxidoreductase subunit A